MRSCFCLLLMLGLSAPMSSARADAMRCGQALVREDTPLPEVLSTCGADAEGPARHRALSGTLG